MSLSDQNMAVVEILRRRDATVRTKSDVNIVMTGVLAEVS